MKSYRIAVWFLGAALAAGTASFAQQPQKQDATLGAVSLGDGVVRLIWQPPYKDTPWPAEGYALERLDGTGKVTPLATGLLPGEDANAMSYVSPAQAEAIHRLSALARDAAAGKNLETYKGALRVVTLISMTDFTFARAMGLAWEDRPTAAGLYTYRLLGPSGAFLGVSAPMDPRTASPVEGPPFDLKAEATPEGVHLTWSRPATEDAPPALSFRVQRDEGSGLRALGDGPILYRSDREGGGTSLPLFTDGKPPVEQSVRYSVTGLDIFGRETPPAQPVSIFVPDFDAAVAPMGLKVVVRGASVVLAWEPKQNPHTAGYLLEKSPFSQGPYALLTEKPMPRSADSYTDANTVPGQQVFYRIASLDPRGKPGAPSTPVGAVCRAAGPPSSPTDLEATLGMNSVTLRWRPVEGHLLGYQVQKAPQDSEAWSPASSRITPEPRFDDRIDLGQSGVVRYRVVAIGSDNQASAPSDVLAVPLPDNNPPPKPRITAFDGAGGTVTLSFVPGAPETDTTAFLVLRGAPTELKMGVITPTPLPVSARTFRDDQVVPDREYAYQIVALDEAQNRSEPSDKVIVAAGEPALTAPPQPAAAFEARPFPRVRLTFAAATVVTVVVERQEGGDTRWSRVAGPLPPGTTEALDPTPPKAGSARYHIYYQTLAGAPGPPSAAVEVLIPAR